MDFWVVPSIQRPDKIFYVFRENGQEIEVELISYKNWVGYDHDYRYELRIEEKEAIKKHFKIKILK